jgi:hypothetical protein
MRHARRMRATVVNKIGPAHCRGKQPGCGETVGAAPLDRVRPLSRLFGKGDQNAPRRIRRQHRFGEIEPGGLATGLARAPQIQALRVDAGHPPAFAGAPEQTLGIELHGIGVVGIHMRDDLRLGGGERGRIRGESQALALDPGNAAEPGDEMAALDRDAMKVEIGETGVDGTGGMPRREAGRAARIVNPAGAPEQRQPRPGERVGIPGGRLEQQLHKGLGREVLCVRCEIGQ